MKLALRLTICHMSVGAGVLWFNFDIPWRRGDPVLLLLKKYNQRYSGLCFVCCCSSIQVVNYQI